MEHVIFDGNGQPLGDTVEDGDILVLVQKNSVSIVRLNLLSADSYGPELEHAVSDMDLERETYNLVVRENPNCLRGDRAYVLRCPQDIARRAEFRV